uniref:Uncharacterized protein n=1 Tax=Equus caballus TaxID=9796 RepID=A0A3Q2I1P8_HORSE
MKSLGFLSSSKIRSHRKNHLHCMNCISFSSAPVNAIVCPTLAIDQALKLQKYEAPEEAAGATLQVKQCTDEISFGNRVLIAKALFPCTLGSCW